MADSRSYLYSRVHEVCTISILGAPTIGEGASPHNALNKDCTLRHPKYPEKEVIGATVNIMDRRAIARLHIGFDIGITF